MEMEFLAPTFNKHVMKIWKKSKCKRMVRKLGKLTEKNYDRDVSDTMFAAYLFNKNDDSEEEREKLKAEKEELIRKNQEWRAKRMNGKNVGMKQRKIVDKDKRNENLKNELVCINCGDELKSEVWTCPIGHPVCGECIDVDNVGEDTDTDSGQESQSQSQSSSGSGESGADDESTESVDVDNGQTDSCKSDSLVVSSYVRPRIDSIDFFANTLDIRKDAIQPYENYNPQEEEDIISVDLGGSNEIRVEDEAFFNKFLHDECPPPYKATSEPDESLKPVSLDKMMDKIYIQDDEKPWKQEFDEKKKEIDFFSDTLDIRKNAIETYIDYKKESFKNHSDDNSYASKNDEDSNDNDSDSSDEDDDDTDDATICLVTNCPKCGVGKLSRNAKIEKIVKTFHLMMQFRQFL